MVSILIADDDLNLCKNLAEELKQREIELGNGKLLPLTALELLQDLNSYYGLTFGLNEQATKENIRDLGEFKWDFARKNGLARAYLSGGGNWGSYDEYLEYSGELGRVVLVNAKGTSQKFLERYNY